MASKTTYPVTPEQSSTSKRGKRHTRGKEASDREKREAKLQLSKSMGDTARDARQRAELTQADVAERIGVATEVYGRLERGLLMPSVPTLRRLCMALNLQADVLLSLGSGPPPAWAAPPLPPPPEGPLMRRLMRHVRKLNPAQLRALSLVAATLLREG